MADDPVPMLETPYSNSHALDVDAAAMGFEANLFAFAIGGLVSLGMSKVGLWLDAEK